MSLEYETDPADADTQPQLPPLLSALETTRKIAPKDKAIGLAAKGEDGIVCYHPATDILDFAISLAPEVKTPVAAQMHYGLMIAMGDAIAALAPPEIAVSYRFPGAILLNRGYAGACGIEMGEADDNGVPGWMVAHGRFVLRSGNAGAAEPGNIPDTTSLAEEGGGHVTRTRLLESVCRNFLLWLNRWEGEGFRPLHDAWKSRLDKECATCDAALEWMGLDGDGAALVKKDGKPASLGLADPATWEVDMKI